MDIGILEKSLAMLENSTPLQNDCGLYCDHACCKQDADGQGGVLLLPGEKDIVRGEWGHFADAMLLCDGFCARERRPFNCRIFPLIPARKKDGTWAVRMDSRAEGICPLFRAGLSGLQKDFIDAATKAVQLLATDPDYEAFLLQWSRAERRYYKDKQSALQTFL